MSFDYKPQPPSPTSVASYSNSLDTQALDTPSTELAKLLGREDIDHSEVLSHIDHIAGEWQKLINESDERLHPQLNQKFEKLLDQVEEAMTLRALAENNSSKEVDSSGGWFSSAAYVAATIVFVAADIIFPIQSDEIPASNEISTADVLREVANQRALINGNLHSLNRQHQVLQSLNLSPSTSATGANTLSQKTEIGSTDALEAREELLNQLGGDEESDELRFDIERLLSDEIDHDFSEPLQIEDYLDTEKIHQGLYGKDDLAPLPALSQNSEGEGWSVGSLFSSFSSIIVDGLTASYNVARSMVLPAQRSLVNLGASSYTPEVLFKEKSISQQVEDLKTGAIQKTTDKHTAKLHAEQAVADAREQIGNANSFQKPAAKESLKNAKKAKSQAEKDYKMAVAEQRAIFKWAQGISYDKNSTKTLSFGQVLDYYLWQTLHKTGGESFNMQVDVNLSMGLDKKITNDLQVNLSTVLEEKNIQRLGTTSLKGLKNLCVALDQSDNIARSSSDILERLREVDKSTPGKTPSKALQKAKPLTIDKYKRETEKKLADGIARLGVPKSNPSNFAIIRFFKRQIYEFKVHALGLTVSSVLKMLGGLEGIFGATTAPSSDGAPPKESGFISKAISGYISHLGLTDVLKNIGDQSDITLYYMIDILSDEVDNIVAPEKKERNSEAIQGVEDQKRELAALREAVDSFDNPEGISEAVFKGQLQPLFELLKIQGDAESLYDVITPLSQGVVPKWQEWVSKSG